MYKIYKKNNYLIIDDGVTTPEEYLTRDILIREVVTDVSYDIYGTSPRFGNMDYQLLNSVSIPNITKENNSPYTASEWIDFYTLSTGTSSSSGGGGGAGDASAANQVISNNKLTSIDNKVATETTLSLINTKTPALVLGKVPVDLAGSVIPLPTGAATAANQQTNAITDAQIRATPLPVSGTVTANAGTNLNTSALGLEATQALIRAKTDNIDVAQSTRASEATLSTLNGKNSSQFVSSTGSLTGATQTVALSLTDESAGTVQISGTWVGTITFEGTVDGTNFNSINAVSASTSSPQTTTTVNGLYRLTPASLSAFRVNMTAFTSGTATISIRATKGTGGIFANQIVPTKNDNIDVPISQNDALLSVVNSTAIPLGISGVFTGTAEDITQYGTVNIAVFSDVVNATDGLSIQQSTNGTNWDNLDNYNIPAGVGKSFSVARAARFFRIVYTNGAVAQSSFRLQVLYTKGTVKPSSIRPQDGRGNDNDMEESASYSHVFNGTSWDRTRGSITNGMLTDVSRIVAQLPAGNNLIGKVGIDQTTDGVTNKIALGQVIFQYSANETGNSTVVQLAAGATYTGTIEAIPNQPAFSVLLFSDQNATLTIRQFVDVAGTQKVYEKIYTYVANSQLAVSAAANGNFFQAIVQNTGGSTTTKLNLNTAYGVIDSATQLNNKPHALYEINGAVVDTNTGNASAGTQRLVLANEQVQDLYFTGQSAQTATIQNIIPATSSATATDVTGFSSGSIQIVSTGTGGTFIFEGTNDSPTSANFQTIPVWNSTIQTGTPITVAITATASAILYVFPINYRYIRVRIATTITGGSIQAFSTIKRTNFTGSAVQVAQATAGNLNMTIGGGTLPTVTVVTAVGSINTSVVPGVAATHLGKAEDAVAASGDTGVFTLGVRRDALTVSASATGDYNEMAVDKYGNILIKDQTRHKRTYSLAFTLSSIAASATDIFQIIGSATTTVSINKINISGTQGTGGQTTITISKRSTANTGGTSTPSTMVVHDSADAAATAVGAIYTANPTIGTPVGNLRIFSLPLGGTTSTTNNIVQLDFGERGKPVVLNGVAQTLVISLGGVTLAGGSINVWIEFTEE